MKRNIQNIINVIGAILPHVCMACGFVLLTFSIIDLFNTSLYLINYKAMKIDIIVLCAFNILSFVTVGFSCICKVSRKNIALVSLGAVVFIYSLAEIIICALALIPNAARAHMLAEGPYKISIMIFAVLTIGANIYASVAFRFKAKRRYAEQ